MRIGIFVVYTNQDNLNEIETELSTLVERSV